MMGRGRGAIPTGAAHGPRLIPTPRLPAPWGPLVAGGHHSWVSLLLGEEAAAASKAILQVPRSSMPSTLGDN